MDKRLEKIENYIRQYHMIEKGDRIVIGVSGGADSVCLLMALCSLQEKLGFQVLVCHVNHELRGEEAAQDEAYVEMLCHKMQVPFFAFHENVELIAKKRLPFSYNFQSLAIIAFRCHIHKIIFS